MITALDTSIVLDILLADPKHLELSKTLFRKALSEGRLIICPVVWGELRPFFDSDLHMEETMLKMNLDYDEFGKKSASLAGSLWQKYRQSSGSRERILADFLIGAHARLKADRLLSRDRGFYRQYFKGLKILDHE